MKTIKNSVIGLAAVTFLVALAGIFLNVKSSATITTGVPFGGNDNGAIQTWAFPQTIIGGMSLSNAPSPIDVSQFDTCTVFMATTNAYANACTNTLTLYRSIDATALTEETVAYKVIQIPCPAAAYTLFQTNINVPDIAGVGFLWATLAPNADSASTTNGTGVGYAGITNAAFPFQVGVATKIKHALR
jgi:hypothetical protein